VVKAIGSLLGIALACALLLGLTHRATTEQIKHNQNAHFWQQVNELTALEVPVDKVEWDENVWHLCNGLVLVRGETRGYGGPIHLLAALQLDTAREKEGQTTVRGVSVTRHQETPGIADFISQSQHPWLQHLAGLDPARIGSVEAVTGATITSRAILRGLAAMTAYPELASSRCSR